ncbi:MAG: hypothetical protein QXT25_00295 [Candidatus Anstonellaceae archaeon]
MGDEELINYILRSRERGRTKDQIMRALLSVGWKKEKIESVFRRLDDPNYLTQVALQQAAQSTAPAQPSQPTSTFQSSQQTQPTQQAPAQPSAPAQQPQPQAQPQTQQAKPFDLFSIFKKPQQEAPKQPQQPQTKEQAPTQQPTLQQAAQQQTFTQPFQVTQFYSIPSWTASSPTITVSLSSQPASPPSPAKQPPSPQKPGLEEFAKNPAFSNLAAAISSSVQSKKSMLPFVLFAIFILLSAAYILTQQGGQKAIQPQPETHINLTKLELEKKNATKQNATLKKPIVITQPPPNATNRTATANQTRQATPTNASQQAQKNATQAATSAYSKYESSQGFPPSVFCQRINAALYRVHYTEFSDVACTNPTQKQDYVYPIDFPYACDEIPCCYPYGSVSRRYDWFECSHYS